jgi:hypothetical protein
MNKLPPTFDFGITGTVPRTDAQIARAKQMAVGGKRKRCTKGKNCSAACIQANMICMVDLPWVVSAALSNVKQMVQSGGGAGGAKPMVQWAGGGGAGGSAPAPKGQTWTPNLPAAAPAAPAATPPAAKPAPAAPVVSAPSAAPATPPALRNVKVLPVDDYKKMGLIFLQDKVLPEAEKYRKDPKIQPVIQNIKKAISELEAEAKAKAAAPPVTAPAATPAAKAPAAKAPAAAPPAAPTATPAAKAPAAKAPAAAPPAAPTATPANKPTPLIQTAEANKLQQPSPSNPHGLSQNQQIIWGEAFKPLTKDQWDKYSGYDVGYANQKYKVEKLQKAGDPDGARIARLLGAAHINKFTDGLAELYKRKLTPEEIEKLPKELQGMIAQHGQSKFRGFLIQVKNFTGTHYSAMRAVMKGRIPHSLKWMTNKEEQDKEIAKIRKNAEKVQQFLETSTVRPVVPKFRGIPADSARLQSYINLAKTGGSFTEDAMNSWSTRPESSYMFTGSKGGSSNRVIFRTMNKTGTSVKGGSSHSHENEILTPGGTKYKVVGYQEMPNPVGGNGNIHVFDVVEY